jgi:hypothetical protein
MGADAYYSLSYSGRNRDIILEFYGAFSKIINESAEDDIVHQAIRDLANKVIQYKIGKDKHLGSKAELHIENLALHDLTESLLVFYAAAEKYRDYRDTLNSSEIIPLYIKNVQDYYNRVFHTKTLNHPSKELVEQLFTGEKLVPRYKSMLKQSLMEFNNALAHIYAALATKDEEIAKNNLHRAQGHFHRSALDFYKAIVKDMAYLGKATTFEDNIFDVRKKEYESIGHDHTNREAVIVWYADLVDEMIKFSNGSSLD